MLCMLVATVDSPEKKRKIEQLYEKYNALMFYVARKVLSRNEDVEDAVYQAWERIIKNIDKINEIDCQKTKNFIVIITERIAIDYVRKLSRTNEVPVEEWEESPYFSTKERELDEVEVIEWVRSIPKQYSEPLILYYVHEMSTKDIAKVLDMKEATVLSRLSRGRKMLRKEVSGHE